MNVSTYQTRMGKKKGRQCGGFPSKAMRAAYYTEWQALASEVDLRGRSTKKQSLVKTQQSQERPKFRINYLQNVLQERLHHDRLEDRARRQSQTRTSRMENTAKQRPNTKQPTPFNTYDEHDDDFREDGLVLLCVKALAPVLQHYIDSMGRDDVHSMLSLLPGKTLTALSVELSLQGLWTSKDILYAVAHHSHLTRLAICLSNNSCITHTDLEEALLLQTSSFPYPPRRVVPDSWEDEAMFEEAQEANTVWRLQRVELRNMPQISAETVLSLITSHTTHVSLIGSLNPTSGLQVVLECLALDDHCLQLLDVSNCDWVTSELLRLVEPNVLVLKAEGCCCDTELLYYGNSNSVHEHDTVRKQQ